MPKIYGHLLPGPLAQMGDTYGIEDRTLSGLSRMAEALDGPLIALAPDLVPVRSLPLGQTRVPKELLPFDVLTVPTSPQAVDSLGLSVVTALHSPQMGFVTDLSTPVIMTSEFTFGIRKGIHQANLRGFRRTKAYLGLGRMEQRLRRQMKSASGAQFNGPAAAKSYGKLVDSHISFYDHRILNDDVRNSRAISPWDGNGRLKLGFSGRLDPMKGPEYAIELADKARRAGMPVDLHVFGTGRLDRSLRDFAGSNVHFKGFRNFRSEWLPEVTERIDIMVTPHVQGDPSCTYFEALGSGTPVLGFKNETLQPLVQNHAVGWFVEPRDTDAMLRQVQAILENPAQLHIARRNGLDLLEENSFEITTQRRADHLMQVSEPAG